MELVNNFITVLSSLFVFVIGISLPALLAIYILYVSQTKQTIRRIFPVIGRFRYWFEQTGKFFSQYFIVGDREARPFNRTERSWIYCSVKGVDIRSLEAL